MRGTLHGGRGVRARAAGCVVALSVALAACGGGDDAAPARAPPTLAPGERIEDGVIVTPAPAIPITQFSTRDWTTDFTRHTVPYAEIRSGGPPKDGIPAIDRPVFVAAREAGAFLDREEPVMVVRVGDDARAYPLQILVWHEIVNDVVGGEPVVVTYCPLCNTALTFRRTFDGRVLDFGTTGNLRHSDLVMYDRQTESWWQQITGEGIIGSYAGKRLEFLPSSILAYQEFSVRYPNGRVLSRNTGYQRPYGTNPYTQYDTTSPFLFTGAVDGRLPALERVVAFIEGGEAVAYPFRVLEQERVVNDGVGGRPVVVVYKRGTRSALDAEAFRDSRDVGSALAFSREVDGRALTFRAAGDGIVDTETGSRWDITGRASGGRLAGKQLTLLAHGNHFWFAWAVFRPDTRVYGGKR